MNRKTIFAPVIVSVIFLNCRKNSDQQNSGQQSNYFITATIDNKIWKVTNYGDASFGTGFFYNKNRFILGLGGQDQTPQSICRLLTINFDFVPRPGRYYFNNIGSLQIDSGIMAVYTRNIGNYQSLKWSKDGYVDIDTITKDSMKGRFSFTVVGDASDTTLTTITDGSFFVFYSGGADKPWPGP